MNDEYQGGYDEGRQDGYNKAVEECDDKLESLDRQIDDLHEEIGRLKSKLSDIADMARDA